MEGWSDFFVAQLGAAAALAGLLFVGASVNLSQIMSYPGLTGRAAQALIQFMTVLVVSSLMLVPAQPLTVVGAEVLAVALVSWLAMTRLHWRGWSIAQMPSHYLVHVVIGQAAAACFLVGGGSMALYGEAGAYWLVPAMIVSFVAAVLNAWVLLVEINR